MNIYIYYMTNCRDNLAFKCPVVLFSSIVLRDEINNLLDTVEDKFSNYIKLKRNILKI